MEKNLSGLVKFTTQNFKNLRKTLRELKKERDEQIRFKPKVSRQEETDGAEKIIFYFSLSNVAKATIVVISMIVLSQFLGEIGHILLIFFISVLFASALNPSVTALERYKIPRALSVLVMYFILLFVLGYFISQLIPLVATQLIDFAKSLNDVVDKFSQGTVHLPFGKSLEPMVNDFLHQIDKEAIINELKQTLETTASQLESFAGNTFEVIKTVFNGVLNFVVVLVLTFFLVVNDSDVNEFFISLFPSKHGAYIAEKIHVIQTKIGYWLRGQIELMVIIFLISLVGLMILGVENALTLAMMIGIGELIPVVGPVLGSIPALLVAFNESPWLALWVILLIIFIHETESNVLVPLVMRRAVGLSPIIIIVAMLVGLETLGIVGMIMAVPVATSLSIFVKEYAEKEK